MKRSVCIYILLLLVISIGSFGLIAKEANALIIVKMLTPGDSTKVAVPDTFKWARTSNPITETPKRFHIKLADNPSLANPIWEDTSTQFPDTFIVYPGTPALEEWHTYYWSIKVQVDTGGVSYWQEEFAPPILFFYTTATTFHIRADGSGDRARIQDGIVWAGAKDTILVEPGIYYENLRVYSDAVHKKEGLIITSRYLSDHDTATINATIIDGSHLTRGDEKGSVIFFESGVDSSITLMGFTIRGGTGTKIKMGLENRINGGGIFCDAGSTPTIAYNVITENEVQDDGGGIFLNSAAPNIFHNIITYNTTVNGSGGGIASAYSIQVSASPSSSPDQPGGDKQETTSPEKLSSDAKIEKSASPIESSLKRSEDEIKNSLNPKDGTDIASADTIDAVITWYARRDSILSPREKYLIGDTLIFDGTGSQVPIGDSIIEYKWRYLRYIDCTRPNTAVSGTSPQDIPNCSNCQVCTLAINSDWNGKLKIFLRITTMSMQRNTDSLNFSIQYPPRADARIDTIIEIADTAWLDGTHSCDINPGDVLTYNWTRISGPGSVSIGDSNKALAYFVPQDSSHGGVHKFQLEVSDGLEPRYDTITVSVDRPPIPVCKNDPLGIYGDTLVGFFTSDTITVDGSSSYDLDPGDSAKYFLWEPAQHYSMTQNGIVSEIPTINWIDKGDSALTKPTRRFTYAFGGILKFYLRVKDRFEVISQNYDSVFYSIQQAPIADAGKDTLLRPSETVYLKATGLEINPDQKGKLKYQWRWVERPSTGWDVLPSDTSQLIYFTPSISGKYIIALTVWDPYIACTQDDEVTAVVNELPNANVVNINHTFEGKDTTLDALSSYDTDSSVFGMNSSMLKFSWSVKQYPPGAEPPTIVDNNKPIARFTPYGTGTYVFRVLVNDTISVKQPPDSSATGNVAFDTVVVDSTYAYPLIQGNLISHNFSGGRGGGIDCNNSSLDIINNIFFKNQSQFSGGAICCRSFSTPQIKSNIFFGNISSDSTGGAISDLKAELSPSATRKFRKNLLVQYNDFWDNRGGALYQVSGTYITNNIYTFPRLIDPDFGDFRLECSSPCRGAGDPLHPDIGSLVYFQPCGTTDTLTNVWLSLFQNPVATAVVHFLINTDAPLKSPPVAYVNIGGYAPGPVYFTPISPNAYRGSYVFSVSGNAKISVITSSLLEDSLIIERDFTVQLISAGKSGTLLSFDKKLSVLFPEGAVKEGVYATCISVSADPQFQFREINDVLACGEAYQVGPSISFDKDLLINFPLSGSDLKDRDKTCFSIYRYEDGKWNQLESFLDGNSVCAKVKNLGVYRLIYDPRGKHITGIPKAFELFQNYPNPFNPETQIRYDLPVSGHVKLTVYNVLGQKTRILVDEIQDAGYKSVIWDGKDEAGQDVASGIYFYKIEATSFEKTKKMVLLK